MQISRSGHHHAARFALFLITLFSIPLLTSSFSTATTSKRARLLVLNSYHIGMTWEDRLNEGMLAELRRSGLEFDVFVEYMDTKRLPRKQLFAFLKTLYAAKYTTLPNVILATDDNAVDFLLEHRDALFPNVPVVFGGVNTPQKAYGIHAQGFTGITETVDIKGTLDLMLKLHPNLKQVVAIADATSSSHVHLQHYRDVTAELATNPTSKVVFEEFANWTFKELADWLKRLPARYRPTLSRRQPGPRRQSPPTDWGVDRAHSQ